jgi:hypothetical protein
MALRPGQVCAACVPDAETNEPVWIITRIERRLASGSYVVRDEDSQSPTFDHYTVSPNLITHYPATDENYIPGEKVLALWYDDESKLWSTMFYEAIVISAEAKTKIVIEFPGSSVQVQTDSSKLTRFPAPVDAEDSPGESLEKSPTDKIVECTTAHKVVFTMGAARARTPEVDAITDDELTAMLGDEAQIRRLRSFEGTPLIDLLSEPGLFPPVAPHIAINGTIVVTPVGQSDDVPALMDPSIGVGRLTKILHDWRK